MQDFVIIVAGGLGKRMGTPLPKQFIEIGKKPILMRTIKRFSTARPDLKIIVSLHRDYFDHWESLCKDHRFEIPHQIVAGGANRFASVQAGLEHISESKGVVAIHDAVRPFVSVDTIKKCFESARSNGNAVPVIPVAESLRQLDGEKNKSVSRSNFRLVQTPQCFDISVIKEAYRQEFSEKFTDDASVLESTGQRINLVEGNRENIKITTATDLQFAEILTDS